MTAEDRNRRAKWGTEIPRSWISDFNMTHPTGHSTQESEQQLIQAVRAKAMRQRIKDQAAQRAAAQRSIEHTLVIGAASVVFLVGAVVGAVATWQQLMPPAPTPQLQH